MAKSSVKPSLLSLKNKDFIFVTSEAGLELCPVDTATAGRGLRVDFLSGAMQTLKKTATLKQPLAKAVGLPQKNLTVIDATAGLCKDAFFLWSLGASVIAIERSSEIFALIEDGYKRACGSSKLGNDFKNRFQIVHDDAAEYLANLKDAERPDVVYVDPMYPQTNKSAKKTALPSKEMQIFRSLVGPDVDSDHLFTMALKQARQRVVVKRPHEAPAFKLPVTHSYESKLVRFDMYRIG